MSNKKAELAQPDFYFDLSSGQVLVGQDAYHKHIESGGHPADIHSITDLAILGDDLKVPTPAEDIDWRQLTGEEVAQNSRWIYHAVRKVRLAANPSAKASSRNIVSAIHRLGLGPGISQVYEQEDLGSLDHFYRMMELPNVHRVYQGWTEEKLIEHLVQLGAKLKRRPLEKDLVRLWRQDPHNNPYPDAYTAIFGTFGEGAEKAGYVAPKAKKWTPERYLDWGLKFRIVNNGLSTDYRTLRSFSKRGYGPSESACIENFGSLIEYNEAADSSYAQYVADRQEALTALEVSLDQDPNLMGLFTQAQSEDDLLETFTKYKILTGELDAISADEIKRLVNLATDDFAEYLINHTSLDGRAQSILEDPRHHHFLWNPKAIHPQLRVIRAAESKPAPSSKILRATPERRRQLAVAKNGGRKKPTATTLKKEIEKDFGRITDKGIGAAINEDLESGAVPHAVLRGATSGRQIVKRYRRYKIASRVLPPTTETAELLNISLPEHTDDEFVRVLRKKGAEISAQALFSIIGSAKIPA